ncbi:MAG: hypothetical protein WBI27_05820, partial [Thermoanaerobaculia bacterium]
SLICPYAKLHNWEAPAARIAGLGQELKRPPEIARQAGFRQVAWHSRRHEPTRGGEDVLSLVKYWNLTNL